MKKCHICNRTYSDETFSFCLADGALLSASFNSPDSENVADDVEKLTLVFGKKVNQINTKTANEQSNYVGSVKYTGAVANDILIGMKPANKGLIIQVYKDQKIGFGGRVQGMFKLIKSGTGDYSQHLKSLENKNIETDELIEHIIGCEKDGKKNIHILNCNMLTKSKEII